MEAVTGKAIVTSMMRLATEMSNWNKAYATEDKVAKRIEELGLTQHQAQILGFLYGNPELDTVSALSARLHVSKGSVREESVMFSRPEYHADIEFASGMVIRRLAERDGVEVYTVSLALDLLRREGFSDVVIQATHVMNGEEYDKLRALAAPYEEAFDRLSFGAPLLTSTRDYQETVSAMLERLPEKTPGQAV